MSAVSGDNAEGGAMTAPGGERPRIKVGLGRQQRDAAILAVSTVLHQQLPQTLRDPARILGDERARIAKISIQSGWSWRADTCRRSGYRLTISARSRGSYEPLARDERDDA